MIGMPIQTEQILAMAIMIGLAVCGLLIVGRRRHPLPHCLVTIGIGLSFGIVFASATMCWEMSAEERTSFENGLWYILAPKGGRLSEFALVTLGGLLTAWVSMEIVSTFSNKASIDDMRSV